jgi:hypothetical protein
MCGVRLHDNPRSHNFRILIEVEVIVCSNATIYRRNLGVSASQAPVRDAHAALAMPFGNNEAGFGSMGGSFYTGKREQC